MRNKFVPIWFMQGPTTEFLMVFDRYLIDPQILIPSDYTIIKTSWWPPLSPLNTSFNCPFSLSSSHNIPSFLCYPFPIPLCHTFPELLFFYLIQILYSSRAWLSSSFFCKTLNWRVAVPLKSPEMVILVLPVLGRWTTKVWQFLYCLRIFFNCVCSVLFCIALSNCTKLIVSTFLLICRWMDCLEFQTGLWPKRWLDQLQLSSEWSEGLGDKVLYVWERVRRGRERNTCDCWIILYAIYWFVWRVFHE